MLNELIAHIKANAADYRTQSRITDLAVDLRKLANDINGGDPRTGHWPERFGLKNQAQLELQLQHCLRRLYAENIAEVGIIVHTDRNVPSYALHLAPPLQAFTTNRFLGLIPVDANTARIMHESGYTARWHTIASQHPIRRNPLNLGSLTYHNIYDKEGRTPTLRPFERWHSIKYTRRAVRIEISGHQDLPDDMGEYREGYYLYGEIDQANAGGEIERVFHDGTILDVPSYKIQRSEDQLLREITPQQLDQLFQKIKVYQRRLSPVWPYHLSPVVADLRYPVRFNGSTAGAVTERLILEE